MEKKRKPTHPGMILEEDYIKPLRLDLEELTQRLPITKETLAAIRTAKTKVTPAIATALAEMFDTTPELWLNLQLAYDVWVEEHALIYPRRLKSWP